MVQRVPFQIKAIAIISLSLFIFLSCGYIVYKSFDRILKTIDFKIQPESGLIKTKSVLQGIIEAESAVKSFSITKDTSYLNSYYNVVSNLDNEISQLRQSFLPVWTKEQLLLIDTLSILIERKFTILNQMINLQELNRAGIALKKVSKEINPLEKVVLPEVKQEEKEEKKGFFKRLFGKKTEQKIAMPDYDSTNASMIRDQMKKTKSGIEKITQEENKIGAGLKYLQLNLSREDYEIMKSINLLVNKIEIVEKESIAKRTLEAEKIVAQTNKIILVFGIISCILLFVVVFVIINYVRTVTLYGKALKESKKEAENLIKAKETFIAQITHELRTPLNSIIGFVEQLIQTKLQNEQITQLDIVRKSANHLLSIINEILDYSKLKAGKVEFEKAKFNPIEVLDETIKIIKQQADKKNINLFYLIEGNIPNAIIGDNTRLKQILLNIIGNSVKFTEKGEISVKVSCTHENKNETVLSIEVKDTGIGISENKLTSIFNEFQQEDATTSKKYGGTGLGLSITKTLVEYQNGKLDIRSKKAIGTSVYIKIPYLKVIDNSINKTNDVSNKVDYSLLENVRILIADDEQYNRKLLSIIFKKWNIHSAEAENGEEVINEIKKNDYDIILMDVRMPVLDGIEATKEIRNTLKKNTPIIALTAGTYDKKKEACIAAGMNDFLSKPFKEIDLYNTIINVLNKTNHEKPGRSK